MKERLARLSSSDSKDSNNHQVAQTPHVRNNAEDGLESPTPFNANEAGYDIGSAPDVDLNSPEAHEKIFYHPEHFLQGHVQYVLNLATQNASAMRLSGVGFKTIVIDPSKQLMVSAVSLRSLASAGKIPLPFKNMQLTSVSAKEAAAFFQDKDVYNAKNIIWLLALGASRGRLPVNTSLDTPVSLLHWPNLTRLQVPPHATRILSLWSHDDKSLRETVAALGIPQRYVFALYSACHAIGLIQAGKKSTQPKVRPAAMREPSAQAQQKQTLFRMLLNKLKI